MCDRWCLHEKSVRRPMWTRGRLGYIQTREAIRGIATGAWSSRSCAHGDCEQRGVGACLRLQIWSVRSKAAAAATNRYDNSIACRVLHSAVHREPRWRLGGLEQHIHWRLGDVLLEGKRRGCSGNLIRVRLCVARRNAYEQLAARSGNWASPETSCRATLMSCTYFHFFFTFLVAFFYIPNILYI